MAKVVCVPFTEMVRQAFPDGERASWVSEETERLNRNGTLSDFLFCLTRDFAFRDDDQEKDG